MEAWARQRGSCCVTRAMADIDRVATCLQEQFPSPPPVAPVGWPTPALNVIDCVLSLNRRYEAFVLPRVKRFAEHRAEVIALADLLALARSYRTPLEFMAAELEYRDERRASTLIGVAEYLLDELRDHDGRDESERLRAWAEAARPGDYLLVGVRGFGLAGFQYLRMLFGAQTTKPDVHIRAFVEEAVGHPVTDVQALLLMERATRRLGLPLRDVDHEIWKARSGARVGDELPDE